MHTSKKIIACIACLFISWIFCAQGYSQEVNKVIMELESAVRAQKKTEIRLKDELAQAQQKNEALNEKTKDLENASAKDAKYISELHREMARLRTDKEKALQKNAALDKRVKQLEITTVLNSKLLSGSKGKAARIEKEKASTGAVALNKRVKDLEATIAQDAKANLKLRDKLEKLAKEKDLYALDLREAQKQSQAESQDKTRLAQDTISLHKRIKELESEISLNNRPWSVSKGKLVRPEKEKAAIANALNEKVAEVAFFKDKIEEAEKDKAVLSALLGLQLQGLRQPQAETDLKKLAQLHFGYGFGLQGKTVQAIKAYRGAAFYDPDDKDIHYNLGYLLSKEGRYMEALKEYKLSLTATSLDRETYYNLAIIYANNLKDIKTARQYYRKFIALSSSAASGAQ